MKISDNVLDIYRGIVAVLIVTLFFIYVYLWSIGASYQFVTFMIIPLAVSMWLTERIKKRGDK